MLTLAPCSGEVWAGRDGLMEELGGGGKHQPNLVRSGHGEGGPLLVMMVGWRQNSPSL